MRHHYLRLAPTDACSSGFAASQIPRLSDSSRTPDRVRETAVATNRHVVMNQSTGQCILPEAVSVITKEGRLQVTEIYLPTWGADDVAILRLRPESTPVTPLRLGFSELVEVGERILTVGFPAPGEGGFEENLYCNVGLVNRIRPSQLCTERVLIRAVFGFAPKIEQVIQGIQDHLIFS